MNSAETKLLCTLLVFPLLYLYYRLQKYRKDKITQYESYSRYEQSPLKRDPLLYWAKSLGTVLSCILLLLAIVNIPITQNTPIANTSPNEVLLLIDTSRSMQVQDSNSTLSRLNRAKEFSRFFLEFVSQVHISLAAFSTHSEFLIPPTQDMLTIRSYIDSLEIDELGEPGTDLEASFQTLATLIKNRSYKTPITVILLSDGEDSKLPLLNTAESALRKDAIIQAAKDLSALRVQLAIVGIGNSSGNTIPGLLYDNKPVVSKLQHELLTQIAQNTHGMYFNAEDYSLKNLVDAVRRDIFIPQNLSTFLTKEPNSNDAQDTTNSTLLQTIALLLLAIVLILPTTWPARVPKANEVA